MKSIKNPVQNTLIIQKSKFITYLFPIVKIEEIDTYIKRTQKEEKGATHICYAYRFKEKEKCTDDKEPQGTAGLPILNMLKQRNINNTLCIVVRYFGGIKLGIGGLYRAYAKAAKEALLKVEEVEKEKGYRIKITFSYEQRKQIENILIDVEITQKSFHTDIIYEFLITEEEYEKIKNKLKDLGKEMIILEKTFLKKEKEAK